MFAGGLTCFIINNSFEISKLIPAILLFVVGLALLIKGGDWFVDGATAIAEKFKVPEVLIGATVVSIGTTLPEVMVSAQAAAKGNSGISYGNAIGSIICNVSLIAAITLAVRPAKVEKKTLRIPAIFFFAAAVFYAINAYVFGQFSRVTGVILLLIFIVYMVINVKQALDEVKSQKEGDSSEAASASKDGDSDKEEEEKKHTPIWLSLILLVFGAAIIAFGATLLVDNGTIIATKMGVPDSVVALTFVALGTSLPELVTAITSLVKGHGALSLGNIIGANIFNLVLVSGLAITIRPFAVPSEKLIAGMNASLLVDIPMVFLVMLLLTVPPLVKGKLYRFQGIALLLIYAAYTAFQFLA
ncbi:MAG: calcium/sodium antiporter [Lachnospiraceae bacterium]|nr:calcium/sodium antiporter [Lachnospiraceae bacterium]